MTSLASLLPPEEFERLRADPSAFMRMFSHEPWLYQADILQRVAADPRRTVIISMPRQNGKSTLSAVICLWRFLTDESVNQIVSVALDTPGAGILFGDARRIIRGSEVLMSLVESITRGTIRLKDGREWMIRSSEGIRSRGLRPAIVAYDEAAWNSDQGELLETLSAAQAAQEKPMMLLTTTAGPVQGGPVYELFQRALGGDPTILLIDHHDNLSPLITEAYLDTQRALLPPSVFNREHSNLWQSGTEVFCTAEDCDRAMSYDPEGVGGQVGGLDLGWHHDESVLALAGVAQTSKRISISTLETWVGTKANPVQLSSIEDRILELAKSGIRRWEIESPQGLLLGQRLEGQGLHVDTVHPTQKSQRERWGALYQALRSGMIALPRDKTLRRQLLSLSIEATSTGWRVEDIASIHQDRAMACAIVTRLLADSAALPLGAWAEMNKGLWAPSRWDMKSEPVPQGYDDGYAWFSKANADGGGTEFRKISPKRQGSRSWAVKPHSGQSRRWKP